MSVQPISRYAARARVPKPWPFVETPAIAIERGANSALEVGRRGRVGRDRRRGVQHQPGVGRDGAVGPGDDRVALELGEVGAQALGQAVGPGDAEQQLHERVTVDRRRATAHRAARPRP